MDVSKTVDVKGFSCPIPVLKANRAIRDIPVGGVLEILATDPRSMEDIEAWAKREGHQLLLAEEKEDKTFRFLIRRGK